MIPGPLSAEARASSWRVFALVLFSAAYFFQSTGHNEAARFDQIRSVIEHGEWWIDRYAWNTADTIQVDGHIYPGKAPGMTLLGALPWGLTRAILRQFPISPQKQVILATYTLTILFAALPTALVSLMLLRFFARNRWTTRSAILLATGYGLGTIAFPWATVFFGHQLSAGLAFGSFYLIWSSRGPTDASTVPTRLAAGLLLGFLPVIEHPGAIASGLIALYAVATLGWRASLPVLVGGFAGACPLALYNQVAFGNPLSLGYGFYAKEGSMFPAHQAGIVGVSWPQWEIAKKITIGTQRGLFYANPWLGLALLAPAFFRRFRVLGSEGLLSVGIFIGFLAFNAGFGNSIVYWGGGYSFGPRHLLIALPFLVLLAAVPMKSPLAAPWFGFLIPATILLMLPAAAVDPRFPYEPEEPFMGFYLPLFARGLFALNPETTFTQTAIFGTTGAFNLGRAAGLPRALEVLPLTLVWAMAAWRLSRVGASRRPRTAPAALVLLAVAAGLTPGLIRLGNWRTEGPGLCRTVSTVRWPYFVTHALPESASILLRDRVPAPDISPDLFPPETWPEIAVTYSGRLEPARAGWNILHLDATGQAAVYVDGLLRARVEGQDTSPGTATAPIYLSKTPHELIVRYMSAAVVRSLEVSMAFMDGPPRALSEGLTTTGCR